MSKRTIFLICLVLLLPAIIFAGGKKEKETALKKMTLEQWEEWAQVGDYRTAEDDWTAIEAAAKEEGDVVIYCNSSRVFDFARTFYLPNQPPRSVRQWSQVPRAARCPP